MQTPYIDSQKPAVNGANAAQLISISDDKKIMAKPAKKAGRSSPALTGCISKVSAVAPHAHSYFNALKDYSAHYAQAQAYLVDAAWKVEHDYSSIGHSPSDPEHGLLGDDGEPVKAAQISDDDIDACGYLAWLRH